MATTTRILILIGLEGPELQDRMNNNKLFWHPMAIGWYLVYLQNWSREASRSSSRELKTNGDGTPLTPRSPFSEMPTSSSKCWE